MAGSIRTQVYQVVQQGRDGDAAGRAFDLCLMTLIALNVAAVVLETVPAIEAAWGPWLAWFDALSVAVFTAEYAVRLWACVEDRRYRRPVAGRLRYAATPLALVDLMAILPFFVPMLIGMDLRELRAVRLFRLLRVLKLARHSRSLATLGAVLRAKREELTIALLVQLVVLLVMSSVMYHVEHAAQPQKFSSIPAAMWWAVVTLTTVGYGDMAPITPLGKLCAGALAMLGVAMFAVPAGILASGFSMVGRRGPAAGEQEMCPHCGRSFADGSAAQAAAPPDGYWRIVEGGDDSAAGDHTEVGPSADVIGPRSRPYRSRRKVPPAR